MIFCLFLLKKEKEEESAACGGVAVMDRDLSNLPVFSVPSMSSVVEKYLVIRKLVH